MIHIPTAYDTLPLLRRARAYIGAPTGRGTQPNLSRDLEEAINALEAALEAAAEREARFRTYKVLKPTAEPHEPRCQRTRLGHGACTCESNTIRRRQEIRNAAAANDLEYRATLGSWEQHEFDRAANGLTLASST